MKKLFLLMMLLVPLLSLHAEDLTIDHMFDKNLIPRDKVKSRSWSPDNQLMESTKKGSDGFKLQFYKVKEKSKHKNNFKLAETKSIDSADIQKAISELNGFKNIKESELKYYKLSPTGKYLLYDLGPDYILYHIAKKKAFRVTFSPKPKWGASFSPDERSLSYIEDNNLFLVDLDTLKSRPITTDGTSEVLYGKLDWVYQEEIYGRGNYKAYWWSPDSQYFAFLRIDESEVQEYPIVDHSKLYGDLYKMNYPKAGNANPKVILGVVPAGGGTIQWVNLDRYKLEEYLIVGVDFTPNSKGVVFQIQNRTQNWLDLNYYDLGKKSTVRWIHEPSKNWVNRKQEAPYWLNQVEFLWQSEHSGFNHLYHYKVDSDSASVKIQTQVTRGDLEVRKLHGHRSFSKDRVSVYYSAAYDDFKEDKLFVSSLDGESSEEITKEDGFYSHTFSPDMKWVLERRESFDLPASLSLLQVKKQSLVSIKQLYAPNLDKWKQLEMAPTHHLTVPTRDGFDMNCILFKPQKFDINRKYPVLSFTYSGPHSPSASDRFSTRNYLWHQFLASQNYLVWICDNRSASGKGHVSETGIYKDFGSEELSDLEDGINYLKEKHTFVDENRLGIWGWSFGGYMSAFALAKKPNLFKMGISVAPVTDWRLYNSIYTERYMSTPQVNEAGYDAASVLVHAEKMEGSLLLIHGILDDNVHIQNAIQLVDILAGKGKDFRQIFYPNSKHGMGSKYHPHMYKEMFKFIQEKL